MFYFVVFEFFDQSMDVLRDFMVDDEKGVSDVNTRFSTIPVFVFEIFDQKTMDLMLDCQLFLKIEHQR